MTKSCYVFELSVSPGGARRGDLWAYSQWSDIRRCIEHEFLNPDPLWVAMAADLAVFYGETIGIWVVLSGKATKFVDLHPFLRARVEGSRAVALDDEAGIGALSAPDGFVTKAEFEVDWDGIREALPPLSGRSLAAGERTAIQRDAGVHRSTYIDLSDQLGYGHTDAENGDADTMIDEDEA